MVVRDRSQHAHSAELNRALTDRGDVQQAIDIDAIDANQRYLREYTHTVPRYLAYTIGYENHVILNEVKNPIAVQRGVQRDGSLRLP